MYGTALIMRHLPHGGKRKLLYGTIDEIDGFASYEAKRADGVETAFCNAVDDYIDACEESGADPKPKLLMLA